MSDNKSYLKAAKELQGNKRQMLAYESQGHCVVLAGPGSGKTKTLTLKLARILSEDVNEPRGLACITYNNECAKELEQRLEELGVEPSERLFIGTVHSFSLTQIILPYAKVANLGLPDEFRVASQTEQRIAFERAYDRIIARGDDPHRFWRLPMDRYRRTYLDRSKQEFLETDQNLAQLVVAYEEELRSHGLIDFDDMPLLSVRALKANPWLREAIKAKYPVIVVDEYQDLGRALHSMIMGLCFRTGIRLFAVGDVDQSIYGFTGANPELLRRLSEREDVEAVTLRLNYRCGSRIVDASQYALGEDRDYAAPEGAKEGTIYFHPLNGNYENQSRYLFGSLLPAIFERIPELDYGEIAILYPAAWIGDSVAEIAQEYDIGVVRADGNAIYPRSSRLMRWLEQCATWCCSGWKTGNLRFSKLVNEGGRIFSESLVSDEDRFRFQRTLLSFLWGHRDFSINLHAWLTNFRDGVLLEKFKTSRTMSDEIKVLETFIERSSTGNDCEGLTLGLFCGHGEGNNRVNLSTLHSSKGREFRVVVLLGLDEGRLPRRGANENEVREGRRLFYVGFTRAKEEVHMMFTGRCPSRFISEIQRRIGGN